MDREGVSTRARSARDAAFEKWTNLPVHIAPDLRRPADFVAPEPTMADRPGIAGPPAAVAAATPVKEKKDERAEGAPGTPELEDQTTPKLTSAQWRRRRRKEAAAATGGIKRTITGAD
ncbi:hypothetical protein PFISCL1PPCAC_7278, partial [Pristionchus fissidentatus]